MTTEEQFLGFLGLINRGGKTCIGSTLYQKIATVKLIILAEDAAPNAAKQAQDKANYRRIPLILGPSKATLGQALGLTSVSAIGVPDQRAANHLIELWKGVHR